MSDPLQAVLVLALIAGLLGAMMGLRRLAAAYDLGPEIQRKAVHIGAGGLACVLPWLFSDRWPVWLLLGLTLVAMVALRSARMAKVGAALHGVERHSYGDYLLVAAVGLCFLLYDEEPVLYVLPLLVLTVADAAAALAGSTYGRIFMTREDGRKSVEGSAVFFLVTFLLSMICLLLLSDTPRENVVLISLVLAVFATLLEADSWHGFDNLFLPMGVLFFLWMTVDVSAWVAAREVGLILVAMAVMAGVAHAMGFDGHIARVHALSVFMVMSAAGAVNTVLPVLAIWAHAWTIRPAGPAPAPNNRPALAFVAVLALVSFGFLALGTAVDVNALDAYSLAAAAICTGFAALWGRRAIAPIVGLGVGTLVAGIWLWVFMTNNGAYVLGGGIAIPWDDQGARPMLDFRTGLLFLPVLGLVVALAQGIFRANPIYRVVALATLPALGLFASQILGGVP